VSLNARKKKKKKKKRKKNWNISLILHITKKKLPTHAGWHVDKAFGPLGAPLLGGGGSNDGGGSGGGHIERNYIYIA
jgi:hypothetical protein